MIGHMIRRVRYPALRTRQADHRLQSARTLLLYRLCALAVLHTVESTKSAACGAFHPENRKRAASLDHDIAKINVR